MGKVILLDFEEKAAESLRAEGIDVELRASARDQEPGGPQGLPKDCEEVFFQLDHSGEGDRPSASLPADIGAVVERGGKIVCFIGDADLVRLTGVIGMFPELHFRDVDLNDGIVLRPDQPLMGLFEKFRPALSRAFMLLQRTIAEADWDLESAVRGKYEFLAKSADGHALSLQIRKNGGVIFLLPWFGSKNAEVAVFLLKEVFPHLRKSLVETGPDSWLDGDDYTFPEIRNLLARREEEKTRHNKALREIDEGIREARANEQESFNRLLKTEGAELRKAIVHAFRYLGWGTVVDVADYWKNVIRNKEEDIWLIETGGKPVEPALQRESLVMVLVRSNKNWATDDECTLLQTYKGRRMQEFENTKMKALLVGNYYSNLEAKLRGNPFTVTQAEETQKDGNGLLTTWDLFQAIKAEKEGRVGKDAIRNQILEKTGVIRIEVPEPVVY